MEKKDSLDHVDDYGHGFPVDILARPTEGDEIKSAKDIEEAYNWDEAPCKKPIDQPDATTTPVREVEPRSIYWNWQFLTVFAVSVVFPRPSSFCSSADLCSFNMLSPSRWGLRIFSWHHYNLERIPDDASGMASRKPGAAATGSCRFPTDFASRQFDDCQYRAELNANGRGNQ